MTRPQLPQEFLKLVETGILGPEEQAEPAMRCAKCGAAVTLVRRTDRADREMTAGIWGKEVLVICPRWLARLSRDSSGGLLKTLAAARAAATYEFSCRKGAINEGASRS